MSLTLNDVDRIAQLARLAITPDEARATLAQLNDIFGLIEKMRAIDSTGVEPLTTPLAAVMPFNQRLRDDIVTETDARERYQGVAPSVDEGLYLVPKVIE